MPFTRITADNFRRLAPLDFVPGPGVNLVVGANAAGKTSLLEAIHTLSRGRSFRGNPADAAGPAGPRWAVHGTVETESGIARSLGVGWSPEGLQVRVDRAPGSLADLAHAIPAQVLEPDSHRLLEEGPVYRRRYLDWGVFHVEHRFFDAWRRYQRALKQRNHALRTGAGRDEVEAWNPELAAAGTEVHELRERHVADLRARLPAWLESLLGPVEWSLDLHRGWGGDQGLAAALAAHYEGDARLATTSSGPHRAELRLRLQGRGAKHHVSRGQEKLLIAALLLAQAQRVAEAVGETPALLIDDFSAELGAPFQSALREALDAYGGQCFVTALDLPQAFDALPPDAMFHVEHGVLREG